MTARNGRSRKPRVGAPSRGDGPDGNPGDHDIAPGLGADDEQGGVLLRRVLFYVAVAVAGCTGAWFLVATVTAGGGSQRFLSVTRPAPGAAGFFTVKLLEFAPSASNRAVAARLVSKAPIRSLAGPHEFCLLELPNQRLALCVGRFDSPDSPEMRQLLRRFQDYAERGNRVFQEASALSFPK